MSKEQFETQILPLQNKLFRYALSIVGDKELARDIVQEVFIKLWSQKERLSEIQNFESWCVRSTRNKAYDKLRLQANKTVALSLVNHQATFDLAPDKNAENQDLVEVIQGLLKLLPEKQREIFRLRDLLGYSNQEIEELMELDATQVKVNLFRARKKIKAKLNSLINYGLENEKTAS